jgi:ElaB/YqjD/DUF883 family membrane-anchored ribosome-binding protein
MNTETLTTPSPELKQHVQDLRQDAGKVAQDLKTQARDGFQEVKTEANARFQNAKGTASDLFEAFRDLAAQHPFKTFGAGVVTGIVLATWRRK